VELVVEVFKEGNDSYIATCPKLNIYGCGRSVEEAVARLKKIVNFYIESAEELGISLEELCNASKDLTINPKSKKELKNKIYLN
jgi:predicted RNase H-like HicB family nuclease